MSVTNTINKKAYVSSADQKNFAYIFKIYKDTDLNVYVEGDKKLLVTNYTVTDVGNESGGNVIFNVGLVVDDYVVIERVLDLTQATDYVENDAFPAETHEDALDRLTYITQQLQESLDRTVKFSTTVTDATNIEFTSDSTDRANKYIAFNSSGDLIVVDGTSESIAHGNPTGTSLAGASSAEAARETLELIIGTDIDSKTTVDAAIALKQNSLVNITDTGISTVDSVTSSANGYGIRIVSATEPDSPNEGDIWYEI
jgi:hypothetical protein